MLHFIKYFFIALILFIVLNLFRSNLDIIVNLKFSIPYVWEWASPAFSLDYLLLLTFSVGFICAGLFGALKIGMVNKSKKRIKQLESELEDTQQQLEEYMPEEEAQDGEEVEFDDEDEEEDDEEELPTLSKK